MILLGNFMNTLLKSFIVASLSLGLFACGGDKPAESTPASSTTQNTHQSDNTITVAVTQDFAPFTFLDEHGDMTGFDVDIINAIGKNKGLNIQFKATSFDNVFTEVEQGTSDVAIASIFATEDRADQYSLTNPYYYSSPIYFYRADNPKLGNANLSTLNDLNGKGLDFAGTAGTKHIERIESIGGANSVKTVKSDFEGFGRVLRKEVDVALTDASILAYTSKMHGATGENALKSVAYMGEQGYVMVLKKDNTELLQTLNDGINELVQSGEIKQFQQKYGLE